MVRLLSSHLLVEGISGGVCAGSIVGKTGEKKEVVGFAERHTGSDSSGWLLLGSACGIPIIGRLCRIGLRGVSAISWGFSDAEWCWIDDCFGVDALVDELEGNITM